LLAKQRAERFRSDWKRSSWKGIAVPHRCKFWLPTLWLPTLWLPALIALLLPALAHAHAILEESTPPAGASVKAGPLTLTFRYNSRIDRARSRLTLIKPDHTHDTIRISPAGTPDIITARLTLTPGSYVVRWQVLATDGHITRGDVPLTVAAP
jgi:methionine-rich copper-binding protein CopC